MQACLVIDISGRVAWLESTANDENATATTAAAAALLGNEWRQTSISHASWSRTPSIERLTN